MSDTFFLSFSVITETTSDTERDISIAAYRCRAASNSSIS